ncbi:hypothetical protein EDB81DRAFT_810253 [Dactylonectria macrodidyma]|uniref:Uncharacterized protein n=1 Tax=Dactylonectria macrodidyma TaxID=307937 RepID=A0A9P9DVH0_9HYPO|nr:hypothetical protein EDB81DRAFT_810253 [Dactylonectria macrodidyma]
MASPPALPKLTHVLNLRAHMGLKSGAAGKHRGGAIRQLAPLSGGFLKGVPGTRAEGLDVELFPGGSDWLLVDEATGVAHLDVRTHGTTEEDDGFFIHYIGYLGLDKHAELFQTFSPDAKTTKAGDHHWWSQPNFETSSEKYQWMTTSMFIGRGHWWKGEDGTQAVEYEIYEVTN